MALLTTTPRRHRRLLIGGVVAVTVLSLPAGAALASTTGNAPDVKARGAGGAAPAFAAAARPAPKVKARSVPRPKPTSPAAIAARGKASMPGPVRTEPAHRQSVAPRGDSGENRPPTWWPWGAIVHGMVTIDTRDAGPRAVTLQRGVVAALGDGSVTVTSDDGFTATWSLAGTIRIWAGGRIAAPSDLAPGQRVGLWGTGPADSPTATVLVIDREHAEPHTPPVTPTDPPTSPTDPPTSPTDVPTDVPTDGPAPSEPPAL